MDNTVGNMKAGSPASAAANTAANAAANTVEKTAENKAANTAANAAANTSDNATDHAALKPAEASAEPAAEAVAEAAKITAAETTTEAAAETATDITTVPKKKKFKKRKVRLHEFLPEHDIKYQGPLHYQYFQAIGWLCIVARMAQLWANIGNRVGDMKGQLDGLVSLLDSFASMALPFLLIANFSQILRNKVGYKRLLIKNGVASLGIIGVFYFFYYRYFLALMALFSKNPDTIEQTMDRFMSVASNRGYFQFNIFMDLFLCVLVMYFLNARPKKVFVGKWRYLFRSFALLPIIYEVGCTVMKYEASFHAENLPVWTFPLLPTKPPMTFLLFLALVAYIKIREYRFCQNGRTHREYLEFLKTRRNSWNVSVFLAVAILVVSLVDFIVLEFLYVARLMPDDMSLVGTAARVVRLQMNPTGQNPLTNLLNVGFGGTITLVVLAPLVLLLSYNRDPKYPETSLLIPMLSFVLIILVMMQGSYDILKSLSLPKVDLEQMVDQVVQFTRQFTM